MRKTTAKCGLHGLAAGLAVLTVLAAAACGPLPRPFQPPREAPANPLVVDPVTLDVWIAPVTGTSRPMSKLIAESVAKGFKLYGIRAAAGERTDSRYRLEGRAQLNRDDPSIPYVVVIHWTLYDRDGKAVGEGTQGVDGNRRDWEYGSPRVIRDIGEETPDIIAAMIEKEDENLQPVRPRLAGLWVSSIEGAPGDGDRSLTRAIKRAIEGAGIAVAEDRRHAEFVLEAEVGLGPPKDGLQRVEIVWTVMTQDGREIGRATQKNMVDAGIFDGPWGDIATIVADAALEGIEGVLRAAGAPRYRLRPSARVLKTEFPTGPGKNALPPPRLELDGLSTVPAKPGFPGRAPPPPR